MLRSILVPLDGSDFSERSLPLAGEVARASGAALHLAHVHVPHEPDHLIGNTSFQWEGMDMAEYDDWARRREKEYLADLEGRLSVDGMTVDAALLEAGPVVDQLAEYARRVDSDMIFITSHAYSGLRRAWRGSVMEGMLRASGVPMLVVHPPREDLASAPVPRLRHILVPLDGSSLAESVLGPAVDLARAAGARITLVRVVPEPTLLGPRIQPVMPERLEQDLTLSKEYLEDVAEHLRGDGIEVEVHVRAGAAVPSALAEIAGDLDTDLVALATHGYRGLRRTVAGSVADQLLHTVRLPMLLMRPPTEA